MERQMQFIIKQHVIVVESKVTLPLIAGLELQSAVCA